MKNTLIIFFSLFVSFSAFAQPYKTIKVYKPYKWMFGAHWSAIDDSGDKFGDIFDFNNAWNIKPFPTKLSLDRYIIYGWSIEAIATYGEYTESKTVNDTTGIKGMLASFDVHGKWSFYNLYAPRARWIEPYFTFGVGYTYREGTADPHVPTVNLGGGLNFWVINRLGIQLASNAKIGVYPGFWETDNNYLQHTIGIVYRTPDKSSYRYPNNKKQHKWTKKQQKFKRKGGH